MPTRPPRHMQAETKAAKRAGYGTRDALDPVRRLYYSPRWKAIRTYQLTSEPLCAYCLAAQRYVPATVCDHVTPHRGNVVAFWSGPFQSLCQSCHNSQKQSEENAPPPRR